MECNNCNFNANRLKEILDFAECEGHGARTKHLPEALTNSRIYAEKNVLLQVFHKDENVQGWLNQYAVASSDFGSSCHIIS